MESRQIEYLCRKAKFFRRRQIISIVMIVLGVTIILTSGFLASLFVPEENEKDELSFDLSLYPLIYPIIN